MIAAPTVASIYRFLLVAFAAGKMIDIAHRETW